MARVKCVFCEEYDDKVIMTNLKKRYIHKECLIEYEKDIIFKEREKKELDRLIDYIKEVHNIKVVPNTFYPFIQDLRNGNNRRGRIIGEKKFKKGYEYNVIRYTYRKHKGNIEWAIRNKSFNGSFAMLKYTIAIITDKISIVERAYSKSKVAKKREEETIRSNKETKEYRYTRSQNKNDISDIL